MKDRFNQELKIGDIIIESAYNRSVDITTIVGFTRSMVRVKRKRGLSVLLSPSSIIKLDEFTYQAITFYLLTK